MVRPYIIPILFLLAGCGEVRTHHDETSAIDRRCIALPGEKTKMTPAASGKQYFPASFGEPAQVCNFKGYPECFATISQIENEWYPEHWDAADEPSLYQRTPSKTGSKSTLRFSWFPSFDHPVIVRIERSGQSAELIAKQLSGQGGYGSGKVERKLQRSLSDTEIAKLDALLTRTRVLDQRATACDLGVDGSQWIVEAADRTGYHFVNRWSPQSGPVYEFGDFALALTGWTFEERY